MSIKHDANLGRELNESLMKIIETTRCEPDAILRDTITCFPGLGLLTDYIDESLEDASARDIQISFDEDTYNDIKSVQDLTETTGIGSITCISIYLTVIQLIIIALSVIFILIYTIGIITNVRNACSCFEISNDIMLELSNYCLLRFTSMHLANGKLKDDDDTMKLFAKYLWIQKQIERFEVGDELIAESKSKILTDLQLLTETTVTLTSLKVFKVFQEEISVKQFENGVPLTTAIVELLMEEEVDESYYKQIVKAFDFLQNALETAAVGFQMDATIDIMLMIGVGVVIAEMALFLGPYVLKLFILRTQMQQLSERFTKLPPLVLSQLCSGGESGSDKVESCPLINTKSSHSEFDKSYISFTFTLITNIGFVVASYFIASNFVTNEATTASSAAYIKTSQGTDRLAACAELIIFMEYIDTNQVNTDLTAFKANLLKKSQAENTNSLVIISSQLGRFIEVEPALNNNTGNLVDDPDHIPAVKCMLDRLSTQYYTHATDNINFLMGITDPGQSFSDEFMYSQVYFYVNFVKENREDFYFNFIIEQIDSDLRKGAEIPNILLALMVISEVLSLLMAVGAMLSIKKKLYNAVQLLRPVNLVHILSDSSLLKLIHTGEIPEEDHTIVFNKADSVIKQTSEAILMLNPSLGVEDMNPAAKEIFGLDVVNKEISEIILEKTPSWERMTLLIHEILSSKHLPSFNDEVEFINSNGKSLYFKVGCFCTCDDHIALDGEAHDIVHIILCFTDETKTVEDTKMIEAERKKTDLLLESILPKEILAQLSNGTDLIATVETSITIGNIKVGTNKRFNYLSDEPHIFYKKVYDELDLIMKDYPLTLKIRTLAHGYSFASGLFAQGIKPDRHAEEACKYALRVINSIPEISAKVGAEVNFTIGIHTGGPVVAGIMSIRHPSLQLIGDVKEYSMAMKGTGDENTVHVTRAIYELIYFSGFNISESGDCEIRPGYVLPTYVIKP